MFFILFMVLFTASVTSPVTSTTQSDKIYINCGLAKSQKTPSLDNLVWQSDDNTSFSPPSINADSQAAIATGSSSSQAPYSHARIFQSPITYLFKVSPGPKFIRLYFSTSSTYNNISASQSFISLEANGLILLHNFSAYLNSMFLPSYLSGYFVEFYVPVQKNTPTPTTILNLTFSSPGNNYGFVNGIEIVPVPNGLYMNTSNNPKDVDNQDLFYNYPNMTLFQTSYRLIMGGSDVPAVRDAGGLGRTWYNDDKYIFGWFHGITTYPNTSGDGDTGVRYTATVLPDTAPKILYASERFIGTNYSDHSRVRMNLTWEFWVDPGFDYLLRLHFCEMNEGVTMEGLRIFTVMFNNIIAEKYVDVWQLSGGLGIPIYKDYIYTVSGGDGDNGVGVTNTTTGKAQLLLALLPRANTAKKDVLLNGLEILKLNLSNGSLAAANSPLAMLPTVPIISSNKSKHHTFANSGVVFGSTILIFLSTYLCIVLYWRRAKVIRKVTILFKRASADNTKTGKWNPTSCLPTDLCRRFSLDQVRIATYDFDESLVIGTGGFGKVYKGVIDCGVKLVAIKRLNPSSNQGSHEFRTEIEMLSRLRHLHLVSLIGFCQEQKEMILVYEYMPRGTLQDHLMYKNNDSNMITTPLSWKERLMICLGSARGLHYLHSGTMDFIIHRDVKSSNILLDDKLTAKVSDFGLCKVGPAKGISSVSTAVKGSIGYLDPEYYKRQRLTEKSDVYSFGVLLFEVLCARPVVNINLPKEQVNLAMWARSCYTSGALHTIVDPDLTGQIAPECLNKFGEIAEMCVRDEGSQRPSMGDVVWALDFSLLLQQTFEMNNINGDSLGELLGTTSVSNNNEDDDDLFYSMSENSSQSSDNNVTLALDS